MIFQRAIAAILSQCLQSSINSFGSVVMAGNSAAANIEGFCYTSLNACMLDLAELYQPEQRREKV